MKHSLQLGVIGSLLLAVTSGLDSGCASPGKRTGEGAAIGGAGGAAVGGALGGWKGAAIGAGIGALAGGGVGNYLDKQAKELAQVAETKRTEQGVLINFKNDLLFDTGQSDLKPEALTQLNQVGDILAKYPDDRIKIEGFTDSRGSEKFNKLLSDERAQAVQQALAQRGVKPQQMMWKGFGPADPVASNKTVAGRAKNRRVEVKIDVPKQQPA